MVGTGPCAGSWEVLVVDNNSARLVLAGVIVLLLACDRGPVRSAAPPPPPAPRLEEVATSTRQWTGVAVSREGRIFVNFPRWSESVPFSVGELRADGTVAPYPDGEVNLWDGSQAPGDRFVCVQAMLVDDLDRLWILDPASPLFAGVVPGGPKLVQVDLATDRVVRTLPFAPEVAPPDSYLNDLRVDTGLEVAYLTDSGNGALVVLDLESGTARRLLDDHPSTRAEEVTLTIGGRPWLLPDGTRPRVHADGIALSPDREHLYFQALTGRTLYRVATAALRDEGLDDAALGELVEAVGSTGAADGIAFGRDGALYLSALEHDAIRRLAPGGEVQTVVSDPRISWPDSFAVGPDGSLYFTTAQIHLGPSPPEPYRLFRIPPPG